MKMIRRLSPVAFLVFACIGCETSKPFKIGVAAGGSRIALHADSYLAADTTTDEAVKSVRISQLAAFRVATVDPITFKPVYESWSAVRPWFIDYSANDAKLSADPTKRMLRTDMTAAFDKNVESERRRRMIWFTFDTPGAIPK